jgi:hypothetical protein
MSYDPYKDFLDGLAKKESSWGSISPEKSYSKVNKPQYLGKYQMGEMALHVQDLVLKI